MERRKTSPSVVPARDALVARLRARFADIPAEHVRRCVDDLWCCCTHLGVRPDERTIERLAASRLTGVQRGARPPFTARPPSMTGPGGARPALRPPLRAPRPPGGRAPASRPAASGRARAGAGTPIGM
ncbi:hypothetical protein [Spirillospora albida]|uniref:hypothetical protein n=1 Tax=Spirillospora albida TaxID=58123 RepID=UPI0005668CB1|nr:hypothetical protein [Spirillospora albida]